MKNYLLILIVSALSLSFTEVHAQKCSKKYVTYKTDPMSGVTTIASRLYLIENNVWMDIVRKGEDYTMEVRIDLGGEHNFKVGEGNEVKVKFNDNQIRSYTTIRDAAPISYVAGAAIMTSYILVVEVSKSDIKKIAEQGGLAVIQTKLSNIEKTAEVKKKLKEKYSISAQCLLKG